VHEWGDVVNGRGEYGRGYPGWAPRAVGVGAIYHSVSDRAEAVRQMASDWTALYQNLASQTGEVTPDPKSSSGYHITSQREWDAHPPDSKKVLWWKSYAKPIFDGWVKFKSEHLGNGTAASAYITFAERFWTNWDVYEDWKKKLDSLRAEALRQGFAISVPAAAELPTTVWSDVAKSAEDAAKGLGDTGKFVKYAVWAALGIGTVVALASVAQSLKAGKDPAEMFRRRAGLAARVIMPPARVIMPSSVRHTLSSGGSSEKDT